MSTIHTATQQIAAALRLQIATLGVPPHAEKNKSRKPTTNQQPGQKSSERDFAERIALRVQSVAIDDPLFKRKVLRIFLESVISAELGASLQNDVRFGMMIDSVQQQMESDPELSSMVESALMALVQAKEP